MGRKLPTPVGDEILKTPIAAHTRTLDFGRDHFALPLFDEDPYHGMRRVIDISGDGPNNNGGPVTVARDAALEKGIIINGLPIMVKDRLIRPWTSTISISITRLRDRRSRFLRGLDQGPRQVQGAIRSKLLLEVRGERRSAGWFR